MYMMRFFKHALLAEREDVLGEEEMEGKLLVTEPDKQEGFVKQRTMLQTDGTG
jgi:hypothetical protein